MKMNIYPMSALHLPDSRLLRLVCHGLPTAVNTLRQAHVGNARRVRTQDVHVRRQDRGIRVRVTLTHNVIKVELVKLDAFDQITIRFWLKRCHVWVDELAVGVEILRGDAGDELLC